MCDPRSHHIKIPAHSALAIFQTHDFFQRYTLHDLFFNGTFDVYSKEVGGNDVWLHGDSYDEGMGGRGGPPGPPPPHMGMGYGHPGHPGHQAGSHTTFLLRLRRLPLTRLCHLSPRVISFDCVYATCI